MSENTQAEGGFLSDSEAIWRAAIAAVEPERLVRESVVREDNLVRIKGVTFDLAGFEKIFLIAFGKAAAAMAGALADILGERLTSGLVVVPGPGAKTLPKIEYIEASHPVPDARSVEAARRALEMAGKAGEKDLVFVCISGGGSSLLTLPADGITLEKKRRLTDDLLRAGASIGELNAVRKHLSAVKGGRLAKAAFPASVVTLLLSDVVGDDPGTIASGPTHWDASTFADARGVLERYGLWDPAPALIRAGSKKAAAARSKRPSRRAIPSSPAPGRSSWATTRRPCKPPNAKRTSAASRRSSCRPPTAGKPARSPRTTPRSWPNWPAPRPPCRGPSAS